MIIGFTGKNGSGKTEAVRFLQTSGYIAYSLSDMIRNELQKRGAVITRDALIEAGRELREHGGPGVLATLLLKQVHLDKNYAIDSIRHPEEVRVLRSLRGFYLFNIEADQKIRFERCVARAREAESTTFADFVADENRELASQNPAGQQLLATAELADVTIVNESSLENFHEQLKTEVLRRLSTEVRPSWDEYFMEIARVASLRSNCMKRKVAAVIVRDNRVISTGYNGTPRGVRNCNEGGCPRCNSLSPSGVGLGDCLCSHAEENAIVQAAHHGMSLQNSTLYTTFSPCLICTKMILNSGIREVVYNALYPMSDLPLQLLQAAGLVVRQV